MHGTRVSPRVSGRRARRDGARGTTGARSGSPGWCPGGGDGPGWSGPGPSPSAGAPPPRAAPGSHGCRRRRPRWSSSWRRDMGFGPGRSTTGGWRRRRTGPGRGRCRRSPRLRGGSSMPNRVALPSARRGKSYTGTRSGCATGGVQGCEHFIRRFCHVRGASHRTSRGRHFTAGLPKEADRRHAGVLCQRRPAGDCPAPNASAASVSESNTTAAPVWPAIS